MFRKPVRSSTMVYSRVGSAHCHNRTESTLAVRAPSTRLRAVGLPRGPWSGVSVTWEPGRNVPRPAEPESLGMGLILGVLTSPQETLISLKRRIPAQRNTCTVHQETRGEAAFSCGFGCGLSLNLPSSLRSLVQLLTPSQR